MSAGCCRPELTGYYEFVYSITIIIIIINEYLEAGLTVSISVQHIYCKHKLQQELH